MPPLFDNLTVTDNQNQVCLPNRRQPVCNQEGGSVLQKITDRVLNQLLGLGVNRAGRFVQYENGRICQYRTTAGRRLHRRPNPSRFPASRQLYPLIPPLQPL